MKRNSGGALAMALVMVGGVMISVNPAQGQPQIPNGGRSTAQRVIMAKAKQHNPSDGLAVSISMAKRVFAPSEPISLRFALTNTSAFTVSVLAWGTPLEGFKKDMFVVAWQGMRVPYAGMLVKRGKPTPADYVAIKPGATLSAVVDLAEGYAIQQPGEYSVEFAAGLPDVQSDAAVQGGKGAPNAVRVSLPALSFVLTGNRPRAPSAKRKAKGFTTCTPSEQQIIGDSFQAAQGYADAALNALQTAGDPATAPRYATWFGTYAPVRYTTVQSHFLALSIAFNTQGLAGFDWVCNPVDCDPGVFAYVFPGDPYTINLCSGFWGASTTGTDSRAGTLVHETTHFTIIAGTQDHAYGQNAAQSLASSDPDRAVNNADNHEYFAENTPPLSMGPTITATATGTPTATATSTSEPQETVTLTPTATDAATNTPEPSATPQATPELSLDVFLPIAVR